MNFNEVVLHPPPRVTINQWKDGSIHFRCDHTGYLPLANLFEQLMTQCRVYADAYKTAIQVETQSQSQAPAVGAEERIQELQNEIARLRGVGIPVSVNTNPMTMTAAQQLAAAVATKSPVTVATPGPSLLEVAHAMATRNTQHPVAAAAEVPLNAPIIPPANVPPMPVLAPAVPQVDMSRQNPGPVIPQAVGITEMAPIIHRPILQMQKAAGVATPDAPHTIIRGGPEPDDGELGPPPATI